ncbi:MAG: hypothetical protein ACRCSK_02840 [Fusobacteriaceae bacterium]
MSMWSSIGVFIVFSTIIVLSVYLYIIFKYKNIGKKNLIYPLLFLGVNTLQIFLFFHRLAGILASFFIFIVFEIFIFIYSDRKKTVTFLMIPIIFEFIFIALLFLGLLLIFDRRIFM